MIKKSLAILGWVLALILLLIVVTNKNQKTKEPPKPQKPLSEIQTPKPAVETQTVTEPSKPKVKEAAVVARVIDGDTVELENGERVRLIGIDTPERGRPYFEEAKQKLAELIEGKEVTLEKDLSERDRYGRLLRYIWLGSVLINLEMVKLGYANSYTYPPDVKYQEEILKAEREARQKQRGLWRPQTSASEEFPYLASRSREPFHYSWCRWAKKISEKNREYFKTRQEATQAGHRPCKVCNP